MSGGTRSSSLKSAFSYCVQEIRSYYYHHFLCLLELPPELRRAAFALRAFNVETAKAIGVASDPSIGLMHLFWWQDAIDKIYANKLIEHPVAQSFSSIISKHKISKTWLKRSIDARIRDAHREPNEVPKTIGELEIYSEDTQSTILYTTLQCGGINSTAADHAASHIGKASGLALLLKSLPYHDSRQRLFAYTPSDVASRHRMIVDGGQTGISADSREGLSNAVFEMASVANTHPQKARALAKTVPSKAIPVLLPAVPTQVLLDSLHQVNFDVFDPRLQQGVLGIPPLWFQLKLKWHSMRERFIKKSFQ